jgi:hypothetical protein
MGNHEFNAIAWATQDLDCPDEFLRSRTKPGNRQQHAAFLAEVEGTARQDEIIEWFRTLPLWLDLGGLRVVHACWHEESMDVLRPLLGADQTLTDEAILRGSRRPRGYFKAICLSRLQRGQRWPLVAYRWDGERELSTARLVCM